MGPPQLLRWWLVQVAVRSFGLARCTMITGAASKHYNRRLSEKFLAAAPLISARFPPSRCDAANTAFSFPPTSPRHSCDRTSRTIQGAIRHPSATSPPLLATVLPPLHVDHKHNVVSPIGNNSILQGRLPRLFITLRHPRKDPHHLVRPHARSPTRLHPASLPLTGALTRSQGAVLREGLQKAFGRMCRFYGFVLDEGQVGCSAYSSRLLHSEASHSRKTPNLIFIVRLAHDRMSTSSLRSLYRRFAASKPKPAASSSPSSKPTPTRPAAKPAYPRENIVKWLERKEEKEESGRLDGEEEAEEIPKRVGNSERVFLSSHLWGAK
ncbi:hypothetical protein KC316_g8 [Hortaea werneckii]|nr:hypothetical protein KC316_g8 [Hortaea werneckii]